MMYAAVYAAQFPLQALLRLRGDLKSKPVVVMEGRATQETVCALNGQARLRGAALGMTRLEVESMNGLVLLARSAEGEAAARAVFLECAAQFSPRIEEASRGTACALVLDITGTERLFGPAQTLAERLRAALAAEGFRASIAVSANYHAARMKAAATRGITVIPEGGEAAALEKLPLATLELAEEHAETFALWGMRTLGELAAAPETELVTRLGAQASDWRQLARGAAEHAFQSIEPALSLQEFFEFDTPVEQMESLLFMGARMIDCLVARAAGRALALVSLTVDMKLEGGRMQRLALRPAVASMDRKFLLKLLQLEIGAHPPEAAVVALTIAAEAGQSSKVQLGLFAPQTPEPSRLDVTLARLKALVGEERVGSPVLEDTHHAGCFRMQGFAVDGKASEQDREPARMALRRMRPPLPIWVVLSSIVAAKDTTRIEHSTMTPAAFRDAVNSFEITAAYGPWRSSGCWWAGGAWDEEEWDVLATRCDGTFVACLLMRDRMRNQWRLEAYYD